LSKRRRKPGIVAHGFGVVWRVESSVGNDLGVVTEGIELAPGVDEENLDRDICLSCQKIVKELSLSCRKLGKLLRTLVPLAVREFQLMLKAD
jgi:hypothetical protein